MDPYQNIRAGVSMLMDYYHRYGDERTALMAYRLGEGVMFHKQSQGIYTNSLAEYALSVRDEYRVLIAEARVEQSEHMLQEWDEESPDIWEQQADLEEDTGIQPLPTARRIEVNPAHLMDRDNQRNMDKEMDEALLLQRQAGVALIL